MTHAQRMDATTHARSHMIYLYSRTVICKIFSKPVVIIVEPVCECVFFAKSSLGPLFSLVHGLVLALG